MNLAEAVVKLLGDTKPLDQSIDSSKAKVNDLSKTGETSVNRFSGAIGMGVKVAGATAALGFAAMTKGALDMEKAQGGFQAATGRSREEAVQFTRDMNGLAGSAGTIGRSFDEITATGTEVARQFDLTGKAGSDMTESFLEFSKVTGQDAVAAVEGLDGTLDAFHLPAEKATELMDKFVVSNQKFGTDVGPEAIGQLNKMAPALQAMGMDLDDGIALLNLFEDAGLDAAGATRGLNTAVKNLPAGTTLEEFLQHLIDMKTQGLDPTQEAIEVFGAKAGVGIANALKPGMNGLEAYQISVDESAGATSKAAESMLTTGDKIRGFFDKFGAGIRDLGQSFGPVLSGVGGLVTAMIPLSGALKGVTTSLWEQVAAQKAAAGGWKGLLSSGAGAAGMAGGVVIGILAINEALNHSNERAKEAIRIWEGLNETQKQTVANTEVLGVKVPDLAQHFANFVGIVAPWHELAGTTEDLAQKMNAVEASANDQAVAMHNASERTDEYADAARRAAEATAEDLREMEGFKAKASEALSLDRASLADDARESMRFVGQAAEAEGLGWARDLGLGIPGEIGKGIYDASQKAVTAADALRDLLKNGLTPDETANKLVGKKHVQLVLDGMESKIPGAKETAQQVAAATINSLEDAGRTGVKGEKDLKAIGIFYDSLLASGLTAGEVRALLAAEGVADSTIDGLESRTSGADNAANAYVDKFTAALRSGKSDVLAAMQYTFGNAMRGQSPPKEGPLRDAVLSAGNVARSYLDHFRMGLRGGDLGLEGLSLGDPFRLSSSGEARVRLDHYIHADPGAIPDGTSEEGIAQVLNRGVDASPLTRQIRALARAGA